MVGMVAHGGVEDKYGAGKGHSVVILVWAGYEYLVCITCRLRGMHPQRGGPL